MGIIISRIRIFSWNKDLIMLEIIGGIVVTVFIVNWIQSIISKKNQDQLIQSIDELKVFENSLKNVNSKPEASYNDNNPKVVEVLQEYADRGDSDTQYDLGIMYRKGEGVIQDDFKAVELFQKAADQGNPHAQYNLGSMYRKGEGVIQNYTKAAELFQESADQGIAYSQYNLGLMHFKGLGVIQSDMKAKKWFGKACDNGYSEGCRNYNFLKKRLLGVI